MVKKIKKSNDYPTYRRFGGKDYEIEGFAPNKRDATARVKRLRKQGHPARYIKRGNSYDIYIHMKRKKPAKPKYKSSYTRSPKGYKRNLRGYKRSLKGYKRNPYKK